MALEKMLIKAFSDSKFKSSAGEFKLQFNPTSYSQVFRVPNQGKTVRLANGTTIDTPVIVEKQEFSLDFYLDSTGVVPGCESVPKAIKELRNLCVDYHGSEHNSYFIELVWGAEIKFRCKCASLDIDYVLFKSSGEPIRAHIQAKFESFEDSEIRAKRHNTSSPDMTHRRIVKSGDNLPKMCDEIYGNSSYYLQVARANKLMNFRKLTPGSELIFPRLNK